MFPEQHLYQVDPAQAPRDGAFDQLKVRDLTTHVGLKFPRPTVPVLFKAYLIAGPETRGI